MVRINNSVCMDPRFRGDDTEFVETSPLKDDASNNEGMAEKLAPYFIGQMASATAPCGGKMVSNLPLLY
jgi:hypothetical protein